MAKFAAKALSNAILFVLLVSPVVTIAAIEVMHKGFRRDMLNLMGEGFLSSLNIWVERNLQQDSSCYSNCVVFFWTFVCPIFLGHIWKIRHMLC
jgi:hypothetical protein